MRASESTFARLAEFLKFGIVGSICLLILYIAYYILLEIFPYPSLVYSLSYGVSLGCNYLLTLSFTFKVAANTKNGLGFMLSHAVNYVTQVVCLNLFLWLGMAPQIAPFPVFVICVPLNFLMVRFFMKK